MLRNGLQYLLFGTGPVTTTGIEACFFFDPDGGERPTIQLYCVPTVYLDRDVSSATPTWGVTVTSSLPRPRARGWVKLRSGDPAAQPLVNCNFFGDPDDLRLTLAAMRHARELLAAEPLASRIREEILPGAALTSDEDLTAFAGKTVKTNYHPSGTARMGPSGDPMSVVDQRLRVHGVEALRVIDCSIIPAIVSANTNAVAMAIGSKAAEMIAADHACPGETMSTPVFVAPILDGAADPTVIWHAERREWWMFYTNRRARHDGPGVGWIHGSPIGVATPPDGRAWTYRGTVAGLDDPADPGLNTHRRPR